MARPKQDAGEPAARERICEAFWSLLEGCAYPEMSVGMLVSEAVPSALEKADGYYRWQVVVRSTSAAAAVRAWRWISSARPPVAALRVAIDIDAVNLV